MILIAVVGIVVLVLVFLIVKWYNLPDVIEQRRKQAEEAEERRKQRREDWNNRPGVFGWRRKRQPVKPKDPVEIKPEEPKQPDALPEVKPAEPESKDPVKPQPRRRLFPRLFNRRK